MAEVFISYKSSRRAAALHLAKILEAHGFSVWFDYALIPGKNFGRHIETELRQAKAVVVLWCPLSVESEWVQNEAALAKRLGKCLPVRIATCEPPLEFLRDDYVDLVDWDGDPSTRSLDRLVDSLEGLVGREAIIERRRLIELHTAWTTFGRPTLAKFALGPELESRNLDRFTPIPAEGSETSNVDTGIVTSERPDANVIREAKKNVKTGAAPTLESPESVAPGKAASAPSSITSAFPAPTASSPASDPALGPALRHGPIVLGLGAALGLAAVALAAWYVWNRPNSSPPPDQRVAECRENTSDPAMTITSCTFVLSKNPNPAAYLVRAEAHHRLGEYEQAIADYTRSMERGATPRALKGRAEAYRKTGKDAEAARDNKEMFRMLAPKQ